MYAEMTIKDFIAQAASNNPIPGGGSVAALAGALSAGLCAMVANLTKDRKGYEAQQSRMAELIQKTSVYMTEFIGNIDKDAQAYNQVMNAYRMPKATSEQKKVRQESIRNALKHAAQVPFDVAQSALNLADLALIALEFGNKNAATDAAVAGLMARSAGMAAIYNVKTNLAMIDDPEFKTLYANKVLRLEADILAKEQAIRSMVEDMINSQSK